MVYKIKSFPKVDKNNSKGGVSLVQMAVMNSRKLIRQKVVEENFMLPKCLVSMNLLMFECAQSKIKSSQIRLGVIAIGLSS